MPESQLASFGEAQLISRFGLVAAPPSLSGSVENIELSGREERKIYRRTTPPLDGESRDDC